MRSAWCVVALGAVIPISGSVNVYRPPSTVFQACPAPRVSQWSSIRDTLWPIFVHRDGDQAWAHLDSMRTPGQTGEWCNPLQNDAEALAAGRNLYATTCSTCHGAEGKGDGPGAGMTDPQPYDFTRPEFAGMREPPGTALLYAMVTRGIEGTPMSGFGHDLGGWERLAVIAYITSLPGAEAARNSRAWADTLRLRRTAPPR